MYEDDPQDTVFDVLGEAVFGGHPLGRPIIGRAPVIRDTPVDEIAAFHAAPLRAGLGRHRGGRLGRPRPDRRAGRDDARRRRRRQRAGHRARARRPAPTVRFQRKDTEQCHVCLGAIGLPRGDDRRFASRVLDAIFGGLSSSRLFQAVREERGLAYSVYSFAGQYADTGQIGLYVGTRPDKVGEAMGVVARGARALARAPRHRGGAQARARERQGARGARAGVDRLAHEPARRVAAVRAAAAGDRRGDGAVRRRHARRAARADGRAVGAGAAVSAAGIGPDEQAFRDAVADVCPGAGVAA